MNLNPSPYKKSALFVFTALVLLGVVWNSYHTYQIFKETVERSIRMESIRGAITYLDEVLTMSARMAAVTGDLAWEKRYRQYEPKLDETIKEATRILPAGIQKNTTTLQTDEANKRLVEMENRAFLLVRQGKAEEAKAVLFSEDYDREKKLYAKGMVGFESILKEIIDDSFISAKKRSMLTIVLSFLIGVMLFVFWAFIARQARLQEAIAKSKQVEQELRDSQALFSGILGMAVEAIVSIDESQRVMLFNKGAEKIFGYEQNEILGQPIELLIPERFRQTHSGHVKEFAVSQTVSRAMGMRPEIAGLRKNGEEFPAEASVVKLTVKGKMVFTILLRDISERKQAERMLHESEEHHRLILKTANDAFVGMCSKGLVTNWNDQAEAVFGWRREEILGKALSDTIIPPQYREAHINGLKKFLHTGEGPVLNRRIELTALRRDGREIPVEITIWPITMGEEVQFNAFIRDLAEKRKLEQQLLQSQKMETVGTLAGGIAHDLNNQLTPVRGYIDLLLQQTDPGHANYQILTEANQSAKRCAEVIQHLTQFSQPTTQKKTVILLSEMFKEFKSIIEKFLPSTIHVRFHCEKDIWPLEANETEIQTVLMNLSVNARDAMPQGGCLTVGAKNIDLSGKPAEKWGKVGQYALVSITDTGGGIPPQVVKRIFEPFFTTKEKGKGTGLGLAMVFKIIQDHQGWIDVSSKVGQGTVFQIYLPAKPGAAVSSVKVQTGIPEHLLAKNETILLADDEEVVRNLGRIFLERLGYKVLVAHDGEEAVKLYQENLETIDMLMLDMTMPKMTGLRMIQKILELNPKAKIVAASGYTSEGTSQELIQQGAADFIQKPYTIVALAQILRKVIDAK